ncbi:MAG: helix-turn-helix transcriptional regulator [Actinobacteria bacterium]|nr:helix-turn-helix transcriptional regulator [Actinomycetota bacterium]
MAEHEARCPGLACFELLGRKWTAQIVWSLLDGPRRFSTLLESVEGVSDKMLTRRLSELEQAGIVTRTYHAEIPPRVEYELTPAGFALREVIVEMERWSHRFASLPGLAGSSVASEAADT